MDFSKIASANGFLVLLMPGSTKPLGLTLEVLPPDHPDLKKYLRTQRDKHRTLSQRGRGVQTADEERWSREMAMIGVVGWEWTMDGDGNPGEWKKDTRRENDETRREHYERLNHPVPEIEIPEDYEYIYLWFWEINGMVDRAGDGYCRPITPGDYKHWIDISGNIVTPLEYDILRAMDVAYKTAMEREMNERRLRAQEMAEIEAANRPQVRKGRR